MKILALETSAKAVSCALYDNGKRLAFSFQNSGLTHSCTLMPMVDDMLRNCGCDKKSLDVIACAAGPGSFTGLRIGIAAAKGLAWGLEKPCAGVSTLEAMAAQLSRTDETVVAVMDARRNQFYNAVFDCSTDEPRRLCEDRAIDINELADELEAQGKSVCLLPLPQSRGGSPLAERLGRCPLRRENGRGGQTGQRRRAYPRLPQTLSG